MGLTILLYYTHYETHLYITCFGDWHNQYWVCYSSFGILCVIALMRLAIVSLVSAVLSCHWTDAQSLISCPAQGTAADVVMSRLLLLMRCCHHHCK